jgi:hypothetical protein
VARNPTFGAAAVDAETDAVTALLNSGFLRIYDGAKPPTPDDAVDTQLLLAELRWSNPAFTPSSGGRAAAAPMPSANASDTGVAAWFRALEPDGATGVFDGTVGSDGDYDLLIDNVYLQAGTQVTVAGFAYSNPKQG